MEEFYKTCLLQYQLERDLGRAITKMMLDSKVSNEEILALIELRDQIQAAIQINEWFYDHRN